ncbi:MAG: hypothetical protein HC880_16810, partial [Bacteroidia bacterium]|nr:hypothetical protein [Bacteroidia bacterium]
MTKHLLLLACLLSFSIIDQLATAQVRGQLVGSEKIRAKSRNEIKEFLSSAVDVPSFIIGIFFPTRNDVDVYKIRYYTTDPANKLVIATGAVYVPRNYNCRATLVTYLHGTITDNQSALSLGGGDEDFVGLSFASSGRYIAFLPDYLGLGAGAETFDYHPYQHLASTANTSVDGIAAARTFCGQMRLRLNDQNFISGYSQGGSAVLAGVRELQRANPYRLNIPLAIAGSGPYALSSVQKDFVFDNPDYQNPSFLPYILQAYERIYPDVAQLIDNNQVFAPAYQNVFSLFDGTKTVEQIDSLLPDTWKDIFQQPFVADVDNNPSNP